MSPFVIFTITLIIVYIVYYSVLLTRDLYGKKSSSRGEEEEFEISSLQEEEAVGVQESENGFSLVPPKEQAKESVAHDSVTHDSASGKIAVPDHTKVDFPLDEGRSTGMNTSGKPTSGNNQPIARQRVSATQDELANSPDLKQPTGVEIATDNGEAVQKKIDKVQEEMDVIDPIGNLTMSKEFFREILLDANKEGSLFIKKTQISIT